ncbi:AmmeMemoRadiSam system protein B [Bifidobacterium leontopitheci]|uniref:Dioxygenase n=1 Tax=Bifidobacterium leontopitheci TaxID=2650774 RepID=A0A6I1GSG7_9BIFI|nr:AmmeMemoRadiSam system protein B [Bifidobacterium leontopitheci]KAB7791138.1 dioxygenase [Bifidobacterium leontopitheci]
MMKSSGIVTGTGVRRQAVAGAFYPADAGELRSLVDRQMDYGRTLLRRITARLPEGCPKAVIVPHAGYVYSGTTAALAYALLERGRGTVTRAVIVGPTHRVAVRGVACCNAGAFATPLGVAPVDVDAERRALDAVPSMIVNDATHAREHAVEVQVPFLQRIFGETLRIVPLNAGDATPRQVGDVIRALWGGPETVIVISSDLSHYHPEVQARELDDMTIARIAAGLLPIGPDRACGAYPVNGLLDVCAERGLRMRFLGCSTSGDDGEVSLAGETTASSITRQPMRDPFERVVGYASFALWKTDGDGHGDEGGAAATVDCAQDGGDPGDGGRDHDCGGSGSGSGDDIADDVAGDAADDDGLPVDAGPVLLSLARTALAAHLGIEPAGPDGAPVTASAIVDDHPWLRQPGASFVTLREGGDLRGCIGTLEAWRELGRDVADHAVDAAIHDPRFRPVTPDEYPLIDIEVSVLGKPEPIEVVTPRWRLGDGGRMTAEPQPHPVRSRNELERALRPGRDGLILAEQGGRGRRATFLPQVWEQLPAPHDFVSHLLAKAGLPAGLDWNDGEVDCARYTVSAFAEER